MINLADKLTAKTVEGILADSNEIKYTKEMGAAAKAETVASELSKMTDLMVDLSGDVVYHEAATETVRDIDDTFLEIFSQNESARQTNYESKEAERDAEFASKEAQRDEATAIIQQEVETLNTLSSSVADLSQEFETAQSDIEQLLNKSEQYTDRFVDNPIANSENAGLMSTADKTKLDSYPSQFVLDLGLVDSQEEGEQEAAKSEVAGNSNISFIRFQVHGVSTLKTTLIMQWPNGINETAQIMCVDKAQWRRNVTGATGVKGAPTNAFQWERTAPHFIAYDKSRRMIQLKDYQQIVSREVELPLATSTQHGMMSAADKTKLGNYPETPLNISTATDDSPGLMSASAHKDLYDTKTIAAGNQTKITDLEAKINEIGNFDTQHQLLARAAEFDIVSNNSIVFIHGTYKQAEGIYHGVFILQQVEMNNNGGGTAMQYIYIEKRQYTRYVSFSPTEVTEVQQVQNHGVQNLSLSGRNLQMTDMWGYNVGIGVTFTDNGNIYEGTPSTSSVPVVLAKTFGGTVTTTLSAATSTRAGMMTAADKTKLDNYPETPLEIPLATENSQGLMSAADCRNLSQASSTASANKAKLDNYPNTPQEIPTANESESGLMSAADKVALDNAAEKADTAFSAASNAKSIADTAQTKNIEQDERLMHIEENLAHLGIAGRYWNEDNATSTAENYYGSLQALRDLPKKLGLGRYLVTDDRKRKKLDPKDSTKYLDGSPAALDGSEGQCMWCWNGFYANVWHEGSRLIKAVTFDKPVGGETSVWIPAGGISWLGAGVMDRTNQKLCSLISDAEQYRGGSGAVLNPASYAKAPAADSPQITMLGMPATNISTTNFGNYARKRGEGWEANWFVARFVVEFLFEVIMGTENSQAAFNAENDANGLYQGGFGTGVTDMPDWNGYNGYYPVIPTSVGLEAGDGVCLVPYSLPQTDGAEGEAYKTFNVPVFFGLVGAGFGHLWQWTRGLIMDAGDKSLVYVTPSMYADYDPNTVADKILVAECPQKEGFIKRKSYQGLCCMPTEVGGTATTRFGDYFGTNASTSKGLRVRAAGGIADYGTYAGASCTDAYSTATYAPAHCSAPLCYFEEDPVIPETQKIG